MSAKAMSEAVKALREGKNCGTCALADWRGQITPTGRFKRDAVTRCGYEIKIPVLPAAVLKFNRERMPYDKSYMQPNDGGSCVCWVKAT